MKTFLSLFAAVVFAGVLLAADPAPKTSTELLAAAREALAKGQLNAATELVRQAVLADPKDPEAQYAVARLAEERRDFTNAVAAYTKVIELDPKGSDAWQWRGTTYFKMGKVPEAVADFEAFVERVPSRRPHHWQLAIALYYVGRADDARRAFELHRTVNPDDVENAAWHFLCNAKANGLDRARKELIPIDGDPRVPMREIFEFYAGKGTEEKIFAAASANKDRLSPAEWSDRMFYAHLYVGLYYDATGNAKLALEHLEKACGEFAQMHYMGDVARVHLNYLKQPPAPAKK
jgi:lipoprotein NlpI